MATRYEEIPIDVYIKKRYRLCMFLVLIPILLFLFFLFSSVMATLLEFPTNRGTLYSTFAINALLMPILCPVPCIIVASVGMALSRIVRRNGRSTKLIMALGIVDIVASMLVFVIAIGFFAIASQQ